MSEFCSVLDTTICKITSLMSHSGSSILGHNYGAELNATSSIRPRQDDGLEVFSYDLLVAGNDDILATRSSKIPTAQQRSRRLRSSPPERCAPDFSVGLVLSGRRSHALLETCVGASHFSATTNLAVLSVVRTLEERKDDAPDSLIDPPWTSSPSSVAVEAVQGKSSRTLT
jgi:hypothetical protein